MDNLDVFLKVIVRDDNINQEFEIKSEKEIKIEEIKNKCKEEFKYSKEDLNNINLFFIDNDNDKNLIINNNDLISNATEISSCFSIELHAEVNKKQNNKISAKEDNNEINNNEKINIINNDEKNNEKEIIKRNKILEKKLEYYEKRIRNLNSYYENLIDSLIKNKETLNKSIYENKNEETSAKDTLEINNNNIINNNEEINKQNSFIIKNEEALKQMKENNDHLFNNLNINQNEIMNKNLKKNGKYYILNKLDFIKNNCKNCDNQSLKNIYKCVLCDDYFICNNCYKTKNKFHKHNDFFEIKYPDEIIRQIQQRINNNITYDKIINKFNVILKDIFFDKDGNLSTKEINNFDKYNLNQICKELNSINESPSTYFSDYKKTYLNQKQLEQFKNADQKLILNKMILFVNKLGEIERDLYKYN